jgi:hypothetical protein
MCSGSEALKRALRCPLVATVSVEYRSTYGWRLRRKQKNQPIQSLVAEWPFTAPPDLNHVNKAFRIETGMFPATQWAFGSQAPEACAGHGSNVDSCSGCVNGDCAEETHPLQKKRTSHLLQYPRHL